MELRCFVSYARDTSSSLVQQLYQALLRLGVDPISHENFLYGQGANLIQRIDSSDFLVAILGNVGREQIMTETGIALGLSRPVLLIREPYTALPASLEGLPQVLLGDADPADSLRFQLEVFLPTLKPAPARRRSTRTKRSVPRRVDEQTVRQRYESAVEEEVARLIEIAGGTVLSEPLDLGERFRPDFAVWFKELGSGFNPVPVEVEGHRLQREEDITRQLLAGMQERGLRIGLIVTLEQVFEPDFGRPRPVAKKGAWTGIVETLSLRELRQSVIDDTFLSRLRARRAELLHEAG